jgi:autotransporter-associated beta strand protein
VVSAAFCCCAASAEATASLIISFREVTLSPRNGTLLTLKITFCKQKSMNFISPRSMNSMSAFHPAARLALLTLACASFGQATELLSWDFNNTTTGATTLGTASAAVVGISASTMTGGGTSGTTTSPANTWNRTFVLKSDAASAITAGNFFSFTTTILEGYTASFSGVANVNMARTSSGPDRAELYYSTDGTNFTKTGNTFTVGSTLASAATDLGADMQIVVPGPATVSWRVVVYGGTGDSRVGFGTANVKDYTLLGTMASSQQIRNLTWTGNDGDPWDTASVKWQQAGNPLAFANNDNATIDKPGAVLVSSGITVGNLTVSNTSGTVVLSGGSLAALTLAKSGAGTLSLASTNTFSGDSTLSGGTIQVAANGSLGSNAVAINGGTLSAAGAVSSLANAFSVATAGGTFEIAGTTTITKALVISGAASNNSNPVTKSGAGTLTFNATGTSAFGTQMTKDGASGGAVDFDITAGGVIFSGSGQRNFGGTNTWNGPVGLNGGTLMFHGGAVEGTGTVQVTANSTIASRFNFGTTTFGNSVQVDATKVLSLDCANGSNALAMAGAIRGDGAVTKTGAGTVRIEGSNEYTGVTTVNAGTLRVGTGTKGTLGSGDVVLAAGTLVLNRDDEVTIPNQISGAGNLTGSSKTTVKLTGNNSYTGVTSCTGGDLGASVLANGGVNSSIGASAAAASNVVLNGGNLAYVGDSPASTNRMFTIGNFGGGISAKGLGAVHFTSTESIAFTDSALVTAGAFIVGTTYKIATAGTTDFTSIGSANNEVGTRFTATGAGSGTGTAFSSNSRPFRLLGSVASTSVFDGKISDSANAPTHLSKSGSGTWAITAANDYTGPTAITEGTLLIEGSSPAASGSISVSAGAFLGGNGLSGGAVILQDGGGVTTRIRDWTGVAGVGHDDLSVASLDAGGAAMKLHIDATGIANFTDSTRSFTILNTTGGITNFNPANVTITAPGFTGPGTWSLGSAGSSLVLTYTTAVVISNYSTWANDPLKGNIPGEPATGDFDRDGLSNLLEYALGLNPTQPSPRPGTFASGVLSFTKGSDALANADVLYEIEQSTTLSQWTTVVTDSPSSSTISYTLPTGSQKQFARLKITQVP